MSAKIEVSDRGKTYEADTKDGPAAMVRLHLNHLRDMCWGSPNPKECRWECRLYEHILSQPDPNAAADAYYETRHGEFKTKGTLMSKREVALKLGWVIK